MLQEQMISFLHYQPPSWIFSRPDQVYIEIFVSAMIPDPRYPLRKRRVRIFSEVKLIDNRKRLRLHSNDDEDVGNGALRFGNDSFLSLWRGHCSSSLLQIPV
uniref:Uncharacterized protein n=1 Tax=Lotus japonicus TaxID=34305 RepID=I3S4C0_LOTJA|nr:unknown [Lotus japonicus]